MLCRRRRRDRSRGSEAESLLTIKYAHVLTLRTTHIHNHRCCCAVSCGREEKKAYHFQCLFPFLCSPSSSSSLRWQILPKELRTHYRCDSPKEKHSRLFAVISFRILLLFSLLPLLLLSSRKFFDLLETLTSFTRRRSGGISWEKCRRKRLKRSSIFLISERIFIVSSSWKFHTVSDIVTLSTTPMLCVNCNYFSTAHSSDDVRLEHAVISSQTLVVVSTPWDIRQNTSFLPPLTRTRSFHKAKREWVRENMAKATGTSAAASSCCSSDCARWVVINLELLLLALVSGGMRTTTEQGWGAKEGKKKLCEFNVAQ